MSLSIEPRHLRRYRDIARLLLRHGRGDLVRDSGLESALGAEEPLDPGVRADAERLAADLEALGPTFIKLGQVLSSRADLLPVPYLEALARLQDKVEPFPFAEVERIVEAELGVRLSKVFQEIESVPLASASLGQVHRAVLRDGRRVAVKVQRPTVREEATTDLEALAEIARLLDRHTDLGRTWGFARLVEEFQRTLLQELDYLGEAANLRTLGRNLARFERLQVPEPIDDLTTRRVLTMTYVSGTNIREIHPVVLTDVDGKALAEELFDAYLRQVLIDGVFHADPHPGNVFLTHDHRLALLDLGMVGRVAPGLRDKLLKLLLAIADGEGESAAALARELGEPLRELEEPERRSMDRRVIELVAVNHDATLERLQVGQLVLEVSAISGAFGIRPPAELTLLGRALLNLDAIGRTLDPAFDPNAAVRRYAGEILRHRMRDTASLSHLLSTVVEAKEFVEELPGRVNRILDHLAENKLRFRVDAIDQDELVGSILKIANRITAGVVLAALIVGAALMMRVETRFTILGYPGLAMLFFLVAAAGGFWLVWSVFWGDRQRPRRPRG